MAFVVFCAVALASWFVGVWGWAQIVGGFQNLKTRGAVMIYTILLWTIIIAASFLLVFKLFRAEIWAWVIGMAISLIQILRAGKIE